MPEGDGYNTPHGPNVKFPWGASTNVWPRLDAQYPGFELNLKLKSEDGQQILARVVQTSVPYPWDSWTYDPAGGTRPGSELRMRKAYLDYRTAKTHGDRFKIQYDMYGDMLLQNRFPLEVGLTDPALDTRFIEDQSREELALAAEVTATYQFSAAHSLLFGTKYVHTIAGPNRGFRFDTETNLPTTPAPDEEQVPVVDIPSGKDNNVSAYAEDRFSFNDHKTDVFAGIRADHDDWRETRTVFLPRAGIIHSISPSLTAKYVFNTGYLRPNAAYSKSGGKFYRSPSKTIENVNVVDQSEEVRSHDVQLTFADKGNYLVGTMFYMAVDNFISWETKLDLGYRNMGEAYSYGGELESRYVLGANVVLNANYSLARGYPRRIPTGLDVNGVTQPLDVSLTNASRECPNYPMHMWNAGLDVPVRDHHSINANVRGWAKMKIVEPFTAPNPGGYGELSGAWYVDASYLARDVVAHFDLRLSAMNLFDNTAPVGMVVNNGALDARGRNLGVQLSKGF